MPADKDLEFEDLDVAGEAPAAAENEAPPLDSSGLPEVGDLPRGAKDLEAVYDIPVQVSAVLAKSTMQVSQLLKLVRGAVVELNRGVGEDMDIHANTRLVATGEVIVIEDRLGVNITEIVKCPSSYKLEQSTA